MEGFYKKRTELGEIFHNLIRSRAPEERFIEFINSNLFRSNRLDIQALEVILDLTLVVVERPSSGGSESNQNNREFGLSASYSADDEGHDETHVFPCHITFDECHPELLYNYHQEHLKSTRNCSIQLVKHPKICEFVIDFMFKNLKNQLMLVTTNSTEDKLDLSSNESGVIIDDSSRANQQQSKHLDNYLASAVNIIKRLDKVCKLERKNCRILSRTNILDIVLNSSIDLLKSIPDKQHIYLDPLLSFAFTLANCRVRGENLKQIFRIIKEEQVDLCLVLSKFERLLNKHQRVMRNIQPVRSINFPLASKTAEEIAQEDSYVSNSWHWRLRSKVIEFKRKQSRNSETLSDYESSRKLVSEMAHQEQQGDKINQRLVANNNNNNTSSSRVLTPSWLECSMIAPLSNISPLMHQNQVKFCCSMWMSVCGDLFVIDRSSESGKVSDCLSEDCFANDWRMANGYWLRLILRKRLMRRYKERMSCGESIKRTKNKKTSRTRRLSSKLRRRQAYDREDEEQEELEESAKRSEEQETSRSGGAFCFLPSISQPRLRPPSSEHRKPEREHKRPPKEFLGRRARDNSQEALMHLVSFAIDSMTIEIWLNVKCMTFCARACRVAREGQSVLMDQVTFPSHLEANDSWSHVSFCLEELGIGPSTSMSPSTEKLMNLKVKVNGVYKEKEKLAYNAHNIPYSNFACLIGCERSTFGYVWKLAQLNLYKELPDKDVSMFLLGKGPDFWSFTNFRQQSTLLLPDVAQRSVKNLLKPKMLHLYSGCDEESSLNWLTQNIQLAYVVHRSDHFLDYSSASPALLAANSSEGGEFINNSERFIQAKILNFSRCLKFNTNHGFGQALAEAGGIENVLICFADIIRRAASHDSASQIHALAFALLLKLGQTNQHHLNKLLDELNGLKLSDFILTHPDCLVSKPMLDHYLKFCLMRKGEYSLIKSPKLICNAMSCWRAWHKDIAVAKSFYKKLTHLLQPGDLEATSSRHLKTTTSEQRKLENYYIEHNFRMMSEAGGIDILMGVLRECLVPLDGETPKINHDLVELIVNLISLLIKHPPGLDVIFDIMEFLLFLHPDHKSYVEVKTDKFAYLRQLPDDGTKLAMELDDELYSNLDGRSGSRAPLRTIPSSSALSSSSAYSEELDNNLQSSSRVTGRSEEDDIFGSSQHFYGQRANESLVNHIRQFNALSGGEDSPSLSERRFRWINSNNNKLLNFGATKKSFNNNNSQKQDQGGQKCSNRNFTIASIADMLASIVKLTSTDPMRILSEALQKPIIDIRKMIILANNNSPLVREKVLGLFLYCLRACYSLNLKPILSKFEQNSEGNFKVCLPIQLMANQLVKYPTTIKMIQLCYGIMVGIDDFETIDTVCLMFDIDTTNENNNNLQLNTLILLMNLMAQLERPKDMVDAIRFVHAYVKQLLKLGAHNGLAILIEHNLIDNMMKMYFAYVEREIKHICRQQGYLNEPPEEDGHEAVKRELDRLLVSIVRYFIQECNLQCLEDRLLIYFDLLNAQVAPRFQYLLRDRKVKVLEVLMSYCKMYEQSARCQKGGGKLLHMFKSLMLKSDQMNTFHNNLSDSQLEMNTLRVTQQRNGNVIFDALDHQWSSSSSSSSSEDLKSDDADETDETSSLKRISKNDVVGRFKRSLELIRAFILAREVGVIPSQLEREFIFKCLRLLANHLAEHKQIWPTSGPIGRQKSSLWSDMLNKLIGDIRVCFSDLILFLLSPTDATNLDERMFCALELLKMFHPEQLVEFLNKDKFLASYKILLMLIKELINFNHFAFSDSDRCDEGDEDDELDCELDTNDTESKLRCLAESLEYQLEVAAVATKNQSSVGFLTSKSRFNLNSSSLTDLDVDVKLCDIWLSKLSTIREDARDRCGTMIKTTSGGGDPSNMNAESIATYDKEHSNFDRILDEAVQITRDVVDDKHGQRKAYLEDLKQNKVFNYHVRQRWLSLIIGHSHERAIWFLDSYYPSSWELNPVEGPSRIRRRLRPCKLALEERFFRHRRNSKGSQVELANLKEDWFNTYSPHPLCSMVMNQEQSADYNELRIRMFTTDKIHFICNCSIIRPSEVCEGEVSVASWCIHFIGERSLDMCGKRGPKARSTATGSFSGSSRQDNTFNGSHFGPSVVEDLWFDEIVEIWDRRYQLQDVGLEIFLTNNMTYLFSFRTNSDKEDFKHYLMREQHKMINLQRYNANTSLLRLSQLWRDGRLTNFDYLTCLNKLAGRSFNDLMQYPVFPFVLSNYVSSTLDLGEAKNFRDLKRPMAVQRREKELIFINNYQDSQCTRLSLGLGGLSKPYHYGNHYSNSATVLHFLVRLPPFTQMLIQYQDNNFDQPDRTFHSMASTWQLITRDSNTDFKELIPEFFFLPEMFVNSEQFELGRKQNNEQVNDVKLPSWCPRSDPRLFTLIQRQALESAQVSKNLHHWIDLVFGYKQTGKAAVEALNVFHPATYYGMIDLNSRQLLQNLTNSSASAIAQNSDCVSMQSDAITNEPTTTTSSIARTMLNMRSQQTADIERLALETMIRTYGQMPRQLFAHPTKQRSMEAFKVIDKLGASRVEVVVEEEEGWGQQQRRLEPLRQVRGLRWGSFVGSPEEGDITAIKHKQLTLDSSTAIWRVLKRSPSSSSSHTNHNNKAKLKFNLCLLPNGDVAIMRENTSLMLDYRADRKSGGSYQPTVTSTKYLRRAGLSCVARMNLFSNMIISRQQLSYIEPPANVSDASSAASASSSLMVSSASSRAKFAPDSLSAVSWNYLDGTVRFRHGALLSPKPNLPLVQADSIIDSVSVCASVPELNLLLVGYTSGSICAHIVSTWHETSPVAYLRPPAGPTALSPAVEALAANSAAPSAVHFLHTSSTPATGALGPGKLARDSATGQPAYQALALAGKTLHSVRSTNKTTRWLYCHSKRITCMRINVNFGIVATGSDDGTCVLWDLNSLTYVRTIDYKLSKNVSAKQSWHLDNLSSMDYFCQCDQQTSTTTSSSSNGCRFIGFHSHETSQSCICASGVNLIAISDTLGDIVTTKDISNRLVEAKDEEEEGKEEEEEEEEEKESSSSDTSLSTILYCHTINANLVGFVNCHAQVTAVCYSSAPEGVSVNVIVVGMADGLIRLYNSWDLSRVKEIHVSGLTMPIQSLLYSRDSQLLYVTYQDGQLVVLRNKKKSSVALPRQWLLQ